MRLVIIPPYKGPNYTLGKGQFMVRELVENIKRKGQLEGIEVDIDEGYPYPAECPPVNRDEVFFAYISLGVIKRVMEYSALGQYDAIVTSGPLGEPGFFAAREISKIPVAGVVHSSVHVASLIGERCSIICPADPGALLKRHHLQNYGLSEKVVSIRPYGGAKLGANSEYVMRFIRENPKEKRTTVPEVQGILEDMTAQCLAAIEKDRADTLIFDCVVLQIFEKEVRERLDKAGYGEIQTVCALSAAVEMAKAMVNLKLKPAPRAYPSDALKAKPESR